MTRILVIDDDQDTARVIKQILIRNNMNVSAFTSPAAALDHWRQYSTEYGLVLSDIRMPGISGFEVTRRVRQVNPDVKVVLMSSFEIHKSEVDKVLPNMQVDDFILKPVRKDELIHTIVKHIGGSKVLPPGASE
ncbi:MAG: response regulator [Nitrososphaera sp.]|jgi:CheY-like chemotaxis protein